MQRTFVAALTFAGILISFAAVSAKPVSDEIIFPNGFRDWFLINSIIVTKDSPISDQIGGIAPHLRECHGSADAEEGRAIPVS